jgi:hypothetical protein
VARGLAALAAAAMVCIGLAGCSQDSAKPPTTTTPPVVLPASEGKGGSSTATTATSFLTNTVWEPATEGSDGSLVTQGHVIVPLQDYNNLFCRTIEMRYVPAPPSEMQLLPIQHLLPIDAAILLPGCLAGQIP